MEPSKKQFVITQVVKNFSGMAEEYCFGPEVKYANVPWQVGYRKEDQSVGVYLFCREPRAEKVWSILTNFSVRLLSVNGKHCFDNVSYTFTNDSQFAGFGSAFNFDSTLRNYVTDDTLIIEVNGTIESMNGIEIPEKKRIFEKTNEQPSDLVLKVEDEKFHVSKAYLVAQSTYFKSLLMGKFKEGKKSVIELKDIDPQVFQTFLELVYMEDTLTDSNIEDVLKLVDMYDAKNPARLCEQFLILESKHSMKTKLQLAAKHNFEKLKTHCLENMKSCADVRAAMGTDSSQLDASICRVLLEKMFSFMLK